LSIYQVYQDTFTISKKPKRSSNFQGKKGNPQMEIVPPVEIKLPRADYLKFYSLQLLEDCL